MIRLALCWLACALAAAGTGGLDESTVTIGILAGPTASDRLLVAGAQRAVAEWNASGALSGRAVRISVLEPSRPWQDGAGRIARLIFEEEVVGLIGPLDASGAHVAAQIATINRIPLIALSPEDSLTRAFDPWIFRGVPGDREQARTVLRGAWDEPRGKRVAVAVPAGRDGRERLGALRDACEELDVTIGAVWWIGRGAGDAQFLEPAAATLDAVLLWLDADPAGHLLELLGRRGYRLLLGSTRLFDEPVRTVARRNSVRLVLPQLGETGAELHETLGHDLTNAMLDAAASTDGSPAAIRRALGDGAIRFDARGNRSVEPMTVEILSGISEAANGRPAS